MDENATAQGSQLARDEEHGKGAQAKKANVEPQLQTAELFVRLLVSQAQCPAKPSTLHSYATSLLVPTPC
jgi:hypothetical protein